MTERIAYSSFESAISDETFRRPANDPGDALYVRKN